jgi:prepilin-type N-terminal cleavage/methylation domain-containing protein
MAKIKIKDANKKGFSYVELLVAMVIFGIGIIFIMQILTGIYWQVIKMRVYFLGAEVVHEKIEEFESMNYSEIEIGEGDEVCYSFIKRVWVVNRISGGVEICVNSVSNSGVMLYKFCINRSENE